jgi:SAM-dependent methyltransferase
MPAHDLKYRSTEREILDASAVPEHIRQACYGDLARLHRWIGNTSLIISQLKRDPLPVRKVLDIGCGHGALLNEIRRQLGVEVVGVDLLPPACQGTVPIVCCDATRDMLPTADVAGSAMMAHQLTADELSSLIRNAARSCRRFLILDLVRHWAPIALFRTFVAPFINPTTQADGIRSIERAFAPIELAQIVHDALRADAKTTSQIG